MRTIKQLVKEQINKEQSYINEHDQVKSMLTGKEGKPMDKRTFNKKSLGDKFRFVYEYGMFYIKGEYSHLIGYKENPFIDSEKFEYYDTCHGNAAIERIEKLKNMDVEKLSKIQEGINKHFNALRDLFGDIERENLGSFHNPVYYEMLRDIYNEEETTNFCKLKLSDFHYLRR
jgi:hypothetical protein